MSFKKAIIVSLILHFIIALFAFVDGKWFFRKTIPDSSTLVIDYDVISNQTTAPNIAADTITIDEKPKKIKEEIKKNTTAEVLEESKEEQKEEEPKKCKVKLTEV